jgi:hypothetical protein
MAILRGFDAAGSPPTRIGIEEGMAASHRAKRVAQKPWLQRLARFGLLTRALLHAVVAILALQVAWGAASKKADKRGALETIAEQPFGRVLLVAAVVGFAGYAAWRLVMAVAGPGGAPSAQTWAKRAGYGARALLYAGIAWSTARLVAGTGGDDRLDEVDATSKLLALPLGRVIVGLVGAAFVAATLWSVYRAVSGKYEEKLSLYEMGRGGRGFAHTVAWAGLFSRAVVWALVALFLLRAAFFHDASETVGLDGALRAVSSAPFGRALLTVLAIGLLGYSAFGLVEARYRRVGSS